MQVAYISFLVLKNLHRNYYSELGFELFQGYVQLLLKCLASGHLEEYYFKHSGISSI